MAWTSASPGCRRSHDASADTIAWPEGAEFHVTVTDRGALRNAGGTGSAFILLQSLRADPADRGECPEDQVPLREDQDGLSAGVPGVEFAQACVAACSTATPTSGVIPDADSSCCCDAAMFHPNASMTPTATGPIAERNPFRPRPRRSRRSRVPWHRGSLLRTVGRLPRMRATRGRGSSQRVGPS